MKRKDFIWDTGWTLNRFVRLIHGFSGRVPMAPDWAGETAHPPVDIVQDDRGLLIELEAPGMVREDLAVGIDGERLTIEGYKAGRLDSGCLRYLCLEREFGVFRRVIDIPANVDTSGVSAELANGVLRIRLPLVSDRRKAVVKVPIAGGTGVENE
ncbi:MAG: Hsp20/alpha crystallin family protein [bacterium]|nr:Hsp20/alpha crystallin family protein [bacterium]MDT8396045.1 Hsp20/alpha crystallin family protein [bacterium]